MADVALVPSSRKTPTKLHCAACGATGEIGCDCGVEYIRAADYAAKMIANPANGDRTNRSIAAEIGVDEKTIRNVRNKSVAEKSATEKRIGKDGKLYNATKAPPAKKVTDVIRLRDWKTGEEYTEPAPSEDTEPVMSASTPGPIPKSPTDPLVIWARFSDDQKRTVLDHEGRIGLAKLVSHELLTELADRAISQDLRATSTSTDPDVGLTKLIRVAVSATDNEAVNALCRIRAKLTSIGRSPSDITAKLRKEKVKSANRPSQATPAPAPIDSNADLGIPEFLRRQK